MTDVRCPMCGKMNPETLDVCQHCEARLKPLQIDQPEDETPLQFSESSDIDENQKLERGISEWLQTLRDSEPEEPGGGEEKVDWIDELREDTTILDEEGEVEPEEEPTSEIPAEFGNVEVESSTWLSEMREGLAPYEEIESDDAAVAGASEEETEWISRIGESEEDVTGGERDIPEWTSGEVEEPLDKGTEDTLESAPDDSLLDMTRHEAEFQADSGPLEEEIPSWLDSFLEDSERKPESLLEEIPAEKQVPVQELKELDGRPEDSDQPESDTLIGEEVDRVEPLLEEDIHIDDSEELPGWLADLESEAPDIKAEADLPEWMVDAQPPQDEEGESLQLPESEQLIRESLTSQTTEEEIAEVEKLLKGDIDWLEELDIPSEIDQTEIPQTPDAETLPPIDPFEGDAEEGEIQQPDEEEEIPEWLSDVADKEAFQELGKQDEEEEEITPAELPDWLEAMRPVESLETPALQPDEEASIVESIGPLSGLRGVLPAEPDISYQTRPPIYSVKLQVSAEQQSDVELFQELLTTESDALPTVSPPLVTSQHILRIIIAAVLFLAILPPLLPGGLKIAPTSLPPAETSEASRIVLDLPTLAPVLFAVDYQPGLSGEMDAAAAAVMDHLMIQGTFITFVSTSPTGPMQAERLIDLVNQVNDHSYQSAQDGGQYVNLGYIPGGQTGLRSFAEDLRGMFPYGLSNQDFAVWDTPTLRNITQLANFSLIVVATDDPNGARAWIEQVQPKIGDTSLIMITSAQIEPTIKPYYPEQVQAMVSGLAGGTAYERSIGRSGSAIAYWSSFSLGMIAAAFLVLIGGGINAINALLARGKNGDISGGIL